MAVATELTRNEAGPVGSFQAFAGRTQAAAPVAVGYGKSFSSFGEIVQGRLSTDEDFLVTLPVDLWSACELVCTAIKGPLVVECPFEKSRAVISLVLEELGITRGYHIAVDFTRNIPIGKGLSSSTADMLAVLRALQEVFGFLFRESFLSRVFHQIEPHDALFYNSSVVYNHREGRLIRDLNYIPNLHVVAIDGGGEVDTVSYNRRVTFSDGAKHTYDRLLADVVTAFEARDDAAIAACATRSARLHLDATGNALLERTLADQERFQAIGVQATHSGTCAAFLFAGTLPQAELDQRIADIRKTYPFDVFSTRTLSLFI